MFVDNPFKVSYHIISFLGDVFIKTFDIIKTQRRNCVSVEIGMNRKMAEKSKETIKLCKVKLENLKDRLESSVEANIVYNRLLIEKAVLEDNIKKKPNVFFEKLKKIFSNKKEKQICDYFKNS